jgi:hypothetical protein
MVGVHPAPHRIANPSEWAILGHICVSFLTQVGKAEAEIKEVSRT